MNIGKVNWASRPSSFPLPWGSGTDYNYSPDLGDALPWAGRWGLTLFCVVSQKWRGPRPRALVAQLQARLHLTSIHPGSPSMAYTPRPRCLVAQARLDELHSRQLLPLTRAPDDLNGAAPIRVRGGQIITIDPARARAAHCTQCNGKPEHEARACQAATCPNMVDWHVDGDGSRLTRLHKLCVAMLALLSIGTPPSPARPLPACGSPRVSGGSLLWLPSL